MVLTLFLIQQSLGGGLFSSSAYGEVAPTQDPLNPQTAVIPVGSAPQTSTTTSATSATTSTTNLRSASDTFFLQTPLSSPTATTSVTTTVPHANAPEPLQEEHQAVLDLVKYEDVTHRAKAGCRACLWSDPNTWEGGVAPTTDAKVLIPENTKIILDRVSKETLSTLRIDGTLEFDPTKETGLKVETIVVSTTGFFIMGTEDNPVRPDVEAKIIIADRGAIDTSKDPRLLGRGLISHGTVQMAGAKTTEKLELTHVPLQRENQIVLPEVPVNWKVGDRLLITGNDPNRDNTEEVGITQILGTTVKFDKALAYNHTSPSGAPVYAANVSRNVVIESENVRDITRRGHVMFMHSPKVKIENVGFYGLGRTDKRVPVNDPLLDDNGKLVPGTGTNARGRYAVHFHRTGNDATNPPAVVKSSVVVDSPGLGFVNHSSNVIFDDNIAFDVVGSGYFTETGNEIGAFRRNLAVHITGSGQDIGSRSELLQDFGHSGHGFWFQGAGVEVEDNVVVGTRDTAYVFFTKGLKEEGLGDTKFLAANLHNLLCACGATVLEVGAVSIDDFKGNIAIGAKDGFETWHHLLGVRHAERSLIEDFTGWNLRAGGAGLFYTGQTTLRNVRLFGDISNPYRNGIFTNILTQDIDFEDVRIEGFVTGINVPVNGKSEIRGGYLNNVQNIVISTAQSNRREVSMEGDLRFGTLSPTVLRGRTQYDVYLAANFDPLEKDIAKLFDPDIIKFGTLTYNGRQVYYYAQAADYIPFKIGEARSYVPPELIGKTNRELWNQYGLAIGGTVAPSDAAQVTRVNGLVGSPAAYLPDLPLTSAKYTNRLYNYQLQYRDTNGRRVTLTPINLREGWNLITRVMNGQIRTFFVFGDVIPPVFTVSPSTPLVINPLDLKMGFFLAGDLSDNSTGGKPFSRMFTGLDRQQLLTKSNGTRYLLLTFQIKDYAGNATTVNLELIVDKNAPLQKHKTTADQIRPKEPTVTLLSLLRFKELRIIVSAALPRLV